MIETEQPTVDPAPNRQTITPSLTDESKEQAQAKKPSASPSKAQPPQYAVRFELPLSSEMKIDFKEILKRHVQTTKPPHSPTVELLQPSQTEDKVLTEIDLNAQEDNVPNNTDSGSEGTEEDSEDSLEAEVEDELFLGQPKNRITSVLERIERNIVGHSQGNRGYDIDDAFIDDTGVEDEEESAEETQDFFIHKGELQKSTTRKKRKVADDGTRKARKKSKIDVSKKEKESDNEKKKEKKEQKDKKEKKDKKESKKLEEKHKKKEKEDTETNVVKPSAGASSIPISSVNLEHFGDELEKKINDFVTDLKLKLDAKGRFPKEMNGPLSKLINDVVAVRGVVPNTFVDKLTLMTGMQKNTWRGRITKVRGTGSKIERQNKAYQEATIKLKELIASSKTENSVSFVLSNEMQELIFQIISAKMELVRASNDKRLIDGDTTTPEISVKDERDKLFVKLTDLWEGKVSAETIKKAYEEQSKSQSAKKEASSKRKEKASDSESSQQDKTSFSARRKKKQEGQSEPSTPQQVTTPQSMAVETLDEAKKRVVAPISVISSSTVTLQAPDSNDFRSNLIAQLRAPPTAIPLQGLTPEQVRRMVLEQLRNKKSS